MPRIKKDAGEAFKSPFAVALRKLMEEKPTTTQEKLAEVTGKTRQTVSQYVNGISEPGYDTLVKIADYFNVSTDYLLGRTKDRRKGQSIYDSLCLSEESISLLLLTSAAQTSQDKMNELIDYLFLSGKADVTGNPEFYAPGECPLEPENQQQKMSVAPLAKDFSEYFPKLVDMLIQATATKECVVDSFAKAIDSNRRPDGLETVMPVGEYVAYKLKDVSGLIYVDLLFKLTQRE